MDSQADVVKVSILGKESIHCGFHLSDYIAATVVQTLSASTYVLISDSNIAALYHLNDITSAFQKILPPTSRFLTHVIPPGETSKSRGGKARIEDFLLKSICTRDTVIIALGGGVVGDLVGFVAATFMRGVRFVQIPTTLLAMVDSAVGGKTAIDTPHGKNLIGAFWQPQYIFIDASFLETLPSREFANGMAEVIKTAAIWNEDDFSLLESRSTEIISAVQSGSTRDNHLGRKSSSRSDAQQLLLRVISGSIAVKAYIVTKDERETGLRNLVNFGHTIGHAIEAVLTPTILHGECVSIGMILEAEIARRLGVCGQVAVGRLSRCIKAYGLPCSVSDPRVATLPAARLLTVQRLLDIMRIDKKNSGPEKKVVLLSRIGKTYEEKATAVADAIITTVLAEACRVVCGIPRNNPIRMATPGSKSISNRSLVLAALGKGTCRLKNLLHSDDTQVMMAALVDLKGAGFEWEDGGETLVVHGGQGSLTTPPKGKEIYLGNAGTAARFLTTVCTLAHPMPNATTPTTIITGNARMKQRPCGPLVEALQANGSSLSYLGTPGCLPLAINEGFKGGHIQLAASVSSQYVSSILLCAPYAISEAGTILELTGDQVISQPYIDMTIAMMATFGIEVTRRKNATGELIDIYDIPRGVYSNPPVYKIESDASSATYPLAIAAITGTTCTIESIGSTSLQGDAAFAKSVLEPMGCLVVQTETDTTVTGPPLGQLRACGYIDMEPMTDAFLTASVLAAVACAPSLSERRVDAISSNTTRIVGIANQRVKECNRIRAMIDELAKFGVKTKELDDGLEIYGQPVETLQENPRIHCYDDHRVAMAFSVLGAVVKGVVLEEKACVGKTWPNWWDDMENKIGISVEGVELQSSQPGSDLRTKPTPGTSVFLTGMRGAGKTYVGQLAATALNLQFVDADEVLTTKLGGPLTEFVAKEGWPAFRIAELEVLHELMKENPTGAVISLGGGIVETLEARQALKACNFPIVQIERDQEAIVEYLTKETSRPPYGSESIEEVFKRREPWFREVTSHQFDSNFDSNASVADQVIAAKAFSLEVSRFFSHITGIKPNLAPNLAKGKRSYFLSLTYPDLTPALPIIDDLTTGVDAIELRVDLLSPSGLVDTKAGHVPPLPYVKYQLAALRRATNLPIVFTVRTRSQGGAFPDEAQDDAFILMQYALRAGVEYVDVEITWSEKRLEALATLQGYSQLVASWHDWTGQFKWSSSQAREKYDTASKFGDIVKIVGKASSMADNLDLLTFAESVKDAKPLIAINMGTQGQLSRILNPTFSPVSHPLLPMKAAPGQLSFAQIQHGLNLAGQLPMKKYYLFGTPIAQSPSPTLHNSGFKVLGLPHMFGLLETPKADCEDVRAALKAEDFGGAAVTIPSKIDIMALMNGGISDDAQAIGAVNTVIPVTGENDSVKLYGDNTDWQAIRFLTSENLTEPITKETVALVIGAGGTARAAIYAMQKLGVGKITLFNRTHEKAQELADAFGVQVAESLEILPCQPSIVIGTVPANATTLEIGSQGLCLPSSLFAKEKGVVIDLAYKPSQTPLLALALKEAGERWNRVRGVEILLEQGYRQFELWTGRRAPRQAIRENVMTFYEKGSSA